MDNTYFKMVGQKTGNGKIILVAVVDEDFMNCGEVPSIFEVQCLNPAPTIYTGTHPTIKVNLSTLKSRDDLKGMGIAGILTEDLWYCEKRNVQDVFDIALPNDKKEKK